MWFYIFVAILLLVLVFLYYIGLFYRPVVSTGKGPFDGTFRVAYKFGRVPYQNVTTFFKEIMEVYPKCKAVGIYYDDPTSVPATNLRWVVGMILEINGESVVEKETLDELKAKQYRFAYFPAIKEAVVTNFPDRGALSMMIAPMKVYGAINRYNQETGISGMPAIEFYKVTDGFVEYVMPLDNHEAFTADEIRNLVQTETN